MDGERFDSLTRILSSRRTALTGLLGGVAGLIGIASPDDADAHNFVARCRKLPKQAQRRACLRRARAHNRKHRCRAESPAITCAGRCGAARNNCQQTVACTCAPGQSCLPNTSCLQVCPGIGEGCPAGCRCGAPLAENLELLHCTEGESPTASCDDLPQVCGTSADCPQGFLCAALANVCGTNRCIKGCPV
jgi:hypothetical protein